MRDLVLSKALGASVDPDCRVLDVLSCGDLVPTLERYYGLDVSAARRVLLEMFEIEFMRAVGGCFSIPPMFADAGYFAIKSEQLHRAVRPLYVIDDIYFEFLGSCRYALPLCRSFVGVPPAPMSLMWRRTALSEAAHESDSSPRDLRGVHLAIVDDGIFSGSTVEKSVEFLRTAGAIVDTVYVVLANRDGLVDIRQSLGSETRVEVLGAVFAGGWDHSRDLLGVHGLKVGEDGHVPYWNAPHWISFVAADKPALVGVCRSYFRSLEGLLWDFWRFRFNREGDRLVALRAGCHA